MQKLERGGQVRSGGGVAAAHDEPNCCNATVALSAPVRRHGGADVWPLFCPAQRLQRARTCRTSRASEAPSSPAVFVCFIACSSESFLYLLLDSPANEEQVAGGGRGTGAKRLTRLIASTLQWRLHLPVRQRGGTIGWLLLCPAQRLDRSRT